MVHTRMHIDHECVRILIFQLDCHIGSNVLKNTQPISSKCDQFGCNYILIQNTIHKTHFKLLKVAPSTICCKDNNKGANLQQCRHEIWKLVIVD